MKVGPKYILPNIEKRRITMDKKKKKKKGSKSGRRKPSGRRR